MRESTIDFIVRFAPWAMAIVFGVIASLLVPGFFTALNIRNIFMHSAVLGVVVIGEAICLLSGHFDLSVGSIVALSAMVGAIAVTNGVPVPITIVLMLFSGALVGMINGVFIRKVGINAFVVTLSSMLAVRGIAMGIVQGRTIWSLPNSLRLLGSSRVFNIPSQIIILVGLYIIFQFVLSETRFGKHIYITGDNQDAAYASGIKTDRIVISSFVLSGILSAFAALILIGKLNSASPTFADGMVFEAVAAAVIGGVSLQGGVGSLYNVFSGVLLLSIINNVLNLSGISPYWIQTVRGGMILLAVLLDIVKRRRESYE